jgi:Na+-transporting NADH:ubiquinone oxidoreductase subunit NqrB
MSTQVEARPSPQAESKPGSLHDPRAGDGPPPPVRPSGWTRFFSLDNRFLAPALITAILLGGHLSFGILENWTNILLAIGISVVCEIGLGLFLAGKIPHLASAYISGISVGILIRSPYVWPYVYCAALSIASKYVLRWRNRHLWNPSNFGVSALLYLYPAAATVLSIQWGNFMWPMLIVWSFGSLIIARLKRFHICLTYVASFIALAGLRSLITGHPFLASVAPLTGPMYQLFVFFMITDPRTTVSTKRGQCLVAFLVAVVEMVFRLMQVIYAPFYALFLVGPIALAWELARKERNPAAAHCPQK